MFEFYQNPVELDEGLHYRRIYAPNSYALVRQIAMVPIALTEAPGLSTWFPVCWRANGDDLPELIVLRSLFADGRGHMTQPPQTPAALPLLLRAYPFLLSDEAVAAPGIAVLVDDVPADRPSDVGAPIAASPGKLGAGAQQRCRALAVFARDRERTRTMTGHLVDHGLLEPWRLDVDFGPTVLAGESLFVAARAPSARALAGFVRTFGSEGMDFLGAHRFSLFRAGPLVRAAKRALAPAEASAEADLDALGLQR